MVFDRSNGIYRSIIVAIVGWLILVGNAQPISNDAGRKPAVTQSNEKATQSAEIVSNIRGIRSTPETQNVKTDPYEKERNEREKRDLQAQENSAYWAGAMFWVTFAAAVLSIIGIGLVWTTFRETRKANDIARDGNRAWVKLEAKGPRTMVIGHPKSTLHIGVELVNFGQSPATNIRCWGKIYFEPVSTEKIFSDVTNYYKSTIVADYSNVIFTNDKIIEQIDIECLDVPAGRYDIIAVASCCYRVIGKDELHFTARTFDISSQDPSAQSLGGRGQFQFHNSKSNMAMTQVLPIERKDVSAIAT